MAIRIGIIGYGNLAKGVESEIRKNPDMELCGIFTRRDPSTVTTKTPGVPVYKQFQKDPDRFLFISHPGDYQDKWIGFEP